MINFIDRNIRYVFIFKRIYKKKYYNKRIFRLFFIFLQLLKYLFNFKIDMPSLDITMTTNCSLNCKDCCAMIPFIPKEKKWTIKQEQFKRNITSILSAINKLHFLFLVGGEPLLVKDLPYIIEFACKQKQIDTIVIITNGTIAFSEELLNVLNKNKEKVYVSISDYSQNKNLKNLKHDTIINQLLKKGIPYFLTQYQWHLLGEMRKRNRGKKELKKIFKNCWQKGCTVITNNCLHPCIRSAVIQNISNQKFADKIDFLDIDNATPKQIKKYLFYFYRKKFFNVCDFCEHTQELTKKAEQTTELLKIS